MKRMIASIAILALVAGFGFAAPTQESMADAGPVKLTVGYRAHPDDTLDFELPWYVEWQERTNTEIEFIVFPADTYEEKRNLVLASGDIPDIVSVESAIANTYGPDGLFQALDELALEVVQSDMLLDYYSDAAKNYHHRAPDGHLYMIPRFNELAGSPENGIAYRVDVMQELGLTEPDNIEGWYEVLKAVKEGRPDLLPLSTNAAWFEGGYQTMFGPSFDMGFGLYQNYWGFLISEMDAGQVTFLPGTDNYRQLMAFMNRLHANGLLDQEYITNNYNDWWNGKVAAGKEFMQLTNTWRANAANITAENAGVSVDYDTAEFPVNPATGERAMTRVANPWSDFAMAISAESDHQREAMALLDYFYTDEGAEFYVYGIEGVSYGRDDDGNPTVQGWDNRLIGTKRYEIGYPSMFVSPIFLSRFLQGPRAVLMKDHFERTLPIMIGYPSLQTSGPEFEEMTNLFADLQTYVQESSNKFITGDLSVDSDWDGYVAQLERLGADRGTEIVQGWYENYQAFVGN